MPQKPTQKYLRAFGLKHHCHMEQVELNNDLIYSIYKKLAKTDGNASVVLLILKTHLIIIQNCIFTVFLNILINEKKTLFTKYMS